MCHKKHFTTVFKGKILQKSSQLLNWLVCKSTNWYTKQRDTFPVHQICPVCSDNLWMQDSFVPVCEHSKGAVSLDDAPHHADLLRPEQLQWQRLSGHQHHSRVWQHRDRLTAVVIVDRAAVKLLHVWTQVLQHRGQSQHSTTRQQQLKKTNYTALWQLKHNTE